MIWVAAIEDLSEPDMCWKEASGSLVTESDMLLPWQLITRSMTPFSTGC